jgi:AcrR family transcriptional regulator
VSEAGRVYGGRSAGERTATRRDQLLAAGVELIGTQGVADLTVKRVCEQAELSKRYFYEHFPSLEAFVDAVMDAVVEQLAERVRAAERDGTDWPRDRIASFVEAITTDPRLARIILLETFSGAGSLADHRQQVVHRAVELILADFFDAGRHTSADAKTMRMSAYALSGACTELLLGWLEGAVEATANEIVDHLSNLFTTSVEITPRA